MTYQEAASMVAEGAAAIGGKSTYYQWPVGAAPEPPYVLFYFPANDDFFADDENYQEIPQLFVELYTVRKDFDAEAALQAVFRQYGLTYTREETYIESEGLYEVLYQMEVMIDV